MASIPRVAHSIPVHLRLDLVLVLLIICVLLHGLGGHEDHAFDHFYAVLGARIVHVFNLEVMRYCYSFLLFGRRHRPFIGLLLFGRTWLLELRGHLLRLVLGHSVLLLVLLVFGLSSLSQVLEGVPGRQEILANQWRFNEQFCPGIGPVLLLLPLRALLLYFLFSLVSLEGLHLFRH